MQEDAFRELDELLAQLTDEQLATVRAELERLLADGHRLAVVGDLLALYQQLAIARYPDAGLALFAALVLVLDGLPAVTAARLAVRVLERDREWYGDLAELLIAVDRGLAALEGGASC